MKSLERFENVFIHHDSLESEVAQRAYEMFPREKIQVVADRPSLPDRGKLSVESFERSKKNLFITRHQGHFFKRCPGAKKGLACCNYFVLNLGLQCNMDCSYCYLQSFINTPYSIIYSNLDQALAELEDIYQKNQHDAVRVGTGEVIDSLSLDPLTLYSRKLIAFFKNKPKWRLEFKTKSDFVDQFLDCEHGNNVIASWSINPQPVISAEEHLTATLEERLAAAEKCLSKGFNIAFHMDPVIWHEDWKQNYTDLVMEITRRFRPKDLPYISLGALRFQPEQKDFMRERFGMDSMVNRAEVFKSSGGKMRYDQRLREEMFRWIIDTFKAQDPAWKIFLCMETPETWVNTTESLPYKQQDIAGLFKPIHA